MGFIQDSYFFVNFPKFLFKFWFTLNPERKIGKLMNYSLVRVVENSFFNSSDKKSQQTQTKKHGCKNDQAKHGVFLYYYNKL